MNIQVYLLLCGLTVLQCVAKRSEFYTAAVVDYAAFIVRPDMGDDPALTMRKNALNHMFYMEQAARQGADIIVFPECGMTGLSIPTSREHLRPYLTEIPDPTSRSNPCVDATSNTSQILKDLSCASRNYKIYSVMNLPEIAPCEKQDGGDTTAACEMASCEKQDGGDTTAACEMAPCEKQDGGDTTTACEMAPCEKQDGGDTTAACPKDGAFIYNTNIVFDRNGTIIARYRKYNLFVEPGFDTEPTADHVTFDTDFGVRFGMFICFDILFRQPAVALVAEHNITDVVYSTAWFSELPFLTAVQTQAAWSYATNTNFLAAGYNDPANKNTGSGIFAGRDGVVTSVMASDRLSRMLLAKIKKKSSVSERDNTDSGHGTRTKRDDVHENVREEIKDEDKSPSINEGPSSHLFSTSHKGEECVKQKDKIQNSHEHNIQEGNAKRKYVKRNVADGVGLPSADVVQSSKSHRMFETELHLFNTALLNINEGNINQSEFLCHMSLCCNFTFSTTTAVREIQTNTVNRQFYRAAVFDASILGDYQICLIMSCVGPDLESCREDFDHSKSQTPSTVFTEITIDGNFKANGKINSGNNNIIYSNDDIGLNTQRLIMKSNQTIQNLSTFSLYVDSFPDESVNLNIPYGHLNIYQEDLSNYNTSLIGSQNVNKQLNLCHGSLCCQFYIGAEINSTAEAILVKRSQLISNNGYFFRIGVFDGVRTFVSGAKAGLQVCAVFTCTTENIKTCGLLKNQTIYIKNEVDVLETTVLSRNGLASKESDNNINAMDAFNAGLVLKSVEIKGYFEKDNLIIPNTVTTSLLPFKALDFEFMSDNERSPDSDMGKSRSFVTMKANGKTTVDMITFGIFARDFTKDVR